MEIFPKTERINADNYFQKKIKSQSLSQAMANCSFSIANEHIVLVAKHVIRMKILNGSRHAQYKISLHEIAALFWKTNKYRNVHVIEQELFWKIRHACGLTRKGQTSTVKEHNC